MSHQRAHWLSGWLLLTAPACWFSKCYDHWWRVKWYELWKHQLEPPIKYEYHSWRLDPELEIDGVTAMHYWKAHKPNSSSDDFYEEKQKFGTVREALEWVGEVV